MTNRHYCPCCDHQNEPTPETWWTDWTPQPPTTEENLYIKGSKETRNIKLLLHPNHTITWTDQE